MLRVFAFSFVDALATALTVVIFARAVLSWVDVRLPFGLGAFVHEVSEPLLRPLRRAVPSGAGLDISPFLALVLIQIAHAVVLAVLQRLL